MNGTAYRMFVFCLVAALLGLLPETTLAQSPGTAFTYQGQLRNSGGQAISDTCDFAFSLFDAATDGTQIGSTLSKDAVTVADGLFSVSLDFGNSAFDGSSRWLEIGVRCPAGSGDFTTLSPRRAIQSVPYAVRAGSAASVAWGDISGMPADFADGVDDVGNNAHTHVNQTWTGPAQYGLRLDQSGGNLEYGLSATAMTVGVQGSSPIGYGVMGTSYSTGGGRGVYGQAKSTSGTNYGVYGESASTSGRGVYGKASAESGLAFGVQGVSDSTGGEGVRGWTTAATGLTTGVVGDSASTSGRGVYGKASAASGSTRGVFGDNYSTSGIGVYGRAAADSGTNFGIYGVSNSSAGTGVYGEAIADTSSINVGVHGVTSSSSGRGVYGESKSTSGFTYGVYGTSTSKTGYGVRGWASAASGSNRGVYGKSSSSEGIGVLGYNESTSGVTYGVYGHSASTSGRGVYGKASASSGFNYGVVGESASDRGTGVRGDATDPTNINYGVFGKSLSPIGYGVYGWNGSAGGGYGVYGTTTSSKGFAGFFNGKVHVNGTLSKSAGSFKIDHPLDPENKYLSHSFVESPDMMNVYNGNIVLDGNGEATVQLPDYFEALNKDFRYQLTPIGGFAPLYIAREVAGNRFQIAGGEAGMKVSWQVTGVRDDAYAQANPIVVEEEKEGPERGKYLNPGAFGQPRERALFSEPNPNAPEETRLNAEREAGNE